MQENTEKIWDNLFSSKSAPTLEDYNQINLSVNNSERNKMKFVEKVDKIAGSSKKNSALKAGIGYCIAGRYRDAIENLEKAGDSGIKNYCIAKSYLGVGRKSEAVEHFQKAVNEIDNPTIAELERIKVLIDGRDYRAGENALKNLSKVLKGKNAKYHCVYGNLYDAQGEFDKAASEYEKALNIDPEHEPTLLSFAYMLDLHGNPVQAMKLYKRIVQNNPISVNVLLNMAVIYEDNEEYDNAANCIDLILKYYPNHEQARMYKKDIESSRDMLYDEEQEQRKSTRSRILEKPISEYELSVRSRNCLKKMNINTIGDLLRISEQELLSYKNFGETSLTEIRAILESEGLRLGQFNEDGTENTSQKSESEKKKADNELLSKPISELELSVRARRAIDRLSLKTFGEVVEKTEEELLNCKNFGVTSLTEIKEKLAKYNLTLKQSEE
ncbi:DNA-directed RNA polymerase subunit alpha C-terminal domain-containing protein [Sedimentisphaera salicampi]|uniref:DNA-directed RNA polymerase subunit alpha n=1 Tax=Sedimentisphaera salicampi TaxID=1941349 RepID=A0A1W6LJY9_9BACT|nr:DNA-directed RNA polymerase subunit alpha C-terminal domain-containing protein [Sedimentisphaera salicampi]ARN56075.1 DNA-directed RNA polymerase subunit alpha [Sedimentisphaera salicampi]